MNSKAKYYIRLQKVLTASFFVLITIPTLVIIWVTASSSRNEAIDKVKFSETQLIEHRKDVINLYLKHQEELLGNLVRLYSPEYLRDQENLNTVFAAVNKTGDIVDLHVINSSGEQLAYVGPYRSSIAG